MDGRKRNRVLAEFKLGNNLGPDTLLILRSDRKRNFALDLFDYANATGFTRYIAEELDAWDQYFSIVREYVNREKEKIDG